MLRALRDLTWTMSMKDMKTHHCVGLRFLAGAIHGAQRANSKDSEILTHLTRGMGGEL